MEIIIQCVHISEKGYIRGLRAQETNPFIHICVFLIPRNLGQTSGLSLHYIYRAFLLFFLLMLPKNYNYTKEQVLNFSKSI